jgi:hypothetical protein
VDSKIRGTQNLLENVEIIEGGKFVFSLTYKQGEVQEI